MYVIIIYSLIATILQLHAFYHVARCSVVTKQIKSHPVIFIAQITSSYTSSCRRGKVHCQIPCSIAFVFVILLHPLEWPRFAAYNEQGMRILPACGPPKDIAHYRSEPSPPVHEKLLVSLVGTG